MPPPETPPARTPDLLREEIRRRATRPLARADLAAVVAAVTGAGGGTVRATLFFGSRRTGARPAPSSAYDLFVVVDAYRTFYEALRATGVYRGRPAVAAALNRWLPPNQVAVPVTAPEAVRALAKCAVVDVPALMRGVSPRRADHFIAGRLFQPTHLAFAADASAEETLVDALVGAHRATWTWVRPWLPAELDVETYCRTLLRVSFSWEIRPEPAARVEALWEAQREELVAVYRLLLDELTAAGELRTVGAGRYAITRPVAASERRRLERYFRFSRVRSTARWAKYVVTFDDWLDFLLRKVGRHTGRDIVLTARERRLPLVFLWPRVIDYLRHKDGK